MCDDADRANWIRDVLAQYEAPLLRYALRITGDGEVARDVVQETLLRLCRTEPSTIDGHVGPWLFRVCRQRGLDAVRKERRMPTIASEHADKRTSKELPVAQQIENADTGHAIERLLGRLSVDQQEVVRLKFQAGLSYRDISHVTGLSVTNVGYLLHTALRRVREQMKATETVRTEAQQDRARSDDRSISPSPSGRGPG